MQDPEQLHEPHIDREDVRAEHDIGGGYLYRPNELLVHKDDVDQVMTALATSLVGKPKPVRGAARLRLLAVDDTRLVPELVAELRSTCRPSHGSGARSHDHRNEDQPLRVSPNHVLVGFGHPLPFPGGPPRPARLELAPLPKSSAGRYAQVAILDTGVDDSHPWFGSRARPHTNGDKERPPSGRTAQLKTYAGHGTFIAGVVLQHAAAAQLHVRKAFEADGFISDTDVAKLIAALPPEINIVNLSFGAFSHGDVALPAVGDALRTFLQRKIDPVVVAAAGNQSSDRPMWPAAMKGVVAVAATDDAGNAATFTNFGPWVDAAAPGVDVHSAFFEGTLTPAPHPSDPAPSPADFSRSALWSGTSFAAPRVAGAIAAEMSKDPGSAREACLRVLQGAIRRDAELGSVLKL